MEVSAIDARPALNVPRLVALAVRLRDSESSHVLIADAGRLEELLREPSSRNRDASRAVVPEHRRRAERPQIEAAR